MSDWKTSMPRSAPADGKAHILVGVKGKSRGELSGEIDWEQAQAVLMLAQVPYERFLKLKAAMDGVA